MLTTRPNTQQDGNHLENLLIWHGYHLSTFSSSSKAINIQSSPSILPRKWLPLHHKHSCFPLSPKISKIKINPPHHLIPLLEEQTRSPWSRSYPSLDTESISYLATPIRQHASEAFALVSGIDHGLLPVCSLLAYVTIVDSW